MINMLNRVYYNIYSSFYLELLLLKLGVNSGNFKSALKPLFSETGTCSLNTLNFGANQGRLEENENWDQWRRAAKPGRAGWELGPVEESCQAEESWLRTGTSGGELPSRGELAENWDQWRVLVVMMMMMMMSMQGRMSVQIWGLQRGSRLPFSSRNRLVTAPAAPLTTQKVGKSRNFSLSHSRLSAFYPLRTVIILLGGFSRWPNWAGGRI